MLPIFAPVFSRSSDPYLEVKIMNDGYAGNPFSKMERFGATRVDILLL